MIRNDEIDYFCVESIICWLAPSPHRVLVVNEHVVKSGYIRVVLPITPGAPHLLAAPALLRRALLHVHGVWKVNLFFRLVLQRVPGDARERLLHVDVFFGARLKVRNSRVSLLTPICRSFLRHLLTRRTKTTWTVGERRQHGRSPHRQRMYYGYEQVENVLIKGILEEYLSDVYGKVVQDGPSY